MKRNGQGQIKTCRRKQHVKTDGMKGISNLFCGIFAVGGNYNLTRDRIPQELSKWIELIVGYKLYGIDKLPAMVKFYKHNGIWDAIIIEG